MVFVSLREVVFDDIQQSDGSSSSAVVGFSSDRLAASSPTKKSIFVVVTPGSPSKPSNSARNATLEQEVSSTCSSSSSSASSSSSSSSSSTMTTEPTASTAASTASTASTASAAASTSASSPSKPSSGFALRSPPKPLKRFVFFITDQILRQKWVVIKTGSQYLDFRKELQSRAIGECKTFGCCGPLRRVARSPNYKAPRPKWGDPAMVNQCLQSEVMQEFLNDLLAAIYQRECQCESTTVGRQLVESFLQIDVQRAQHAAIVLQQIETQNCHETHSIDLQEQQAEQDTSHPETCPICMGNLTRNNRVRVTCGHGFHRECLQELLVHQVVCPVCRSSLESCKD